jgi:hypothetical protein
MDDEELIAHLTSELLRACGAETASHMGLRDRARFALKKANKMAPSIGQLTNLLAYRLVEIADLDPGVMDTQTVHERAIAVLRLTADLSEGQSTEGASMPGELAAMRASALAVEKLDSAEQQRVINWLMSRYVYSQAPTAMPPPVWPFAR